MDMKTPLRMLLSLCILCQCRSATPPAIREMREALDRARSAPPFENVVTRRDWPVQDLVGMRRSTIHSMLGEPCNCGEEPSEKCAVMTEWSYCFYHLAEDRDGGGPELRLSFSRRDVCEAAAWIRTQ